MREIPDSLEDYAYARRHKTTTAEAVRRRRAARIATVAFSIFAVAGIGGAVWMTIVATSIDMRTASMKLLPPTVCLASSVLSLGVGLYFVGRNGGQSRRQILTILGPALALAMAGFIVRLLF